MTITKQKPDYWVSVGNAYFGSLDAAEVISVPSIKQIGIKEDKAEQKIYGSGIVYEVVSQTTSTEVTVDAIALPQKLVNEYLGRTVVGAANEQKTTDRLKEFAFGYTITYASGKKIFKWFPRCQMTSADETIATKTSDAVDPNRQYVIVSMPLDTNVVRVEYDQTMEAEEAKMVTEDEFFSKVCKSAADVKKAA